MNYFTKLRATFLLLYILIFALSNSSNASDMMDNSSLWQDGVPRFEISFDYPDPVITGEQFLFTIQIKKSASYQVGGTLKCRFFGGLSPKETNLDAAEYTIENQTAIIHWESLTNSNIVSFSIPAISSQVAAGVYPVNISYKDEFGFGLVNSVGIYVSNKSKENLLPYIKPGQEESPYAIRLQYPGDITVDEKYPLKIILEKGKYTGGLELFVKLPPESKIDIADMDNYRYQSNNGHLFLSIKSMPAGPEFVINCTIQNINPTSSVYPITASAKLDNNIKLNFAHTIFVSEQNTQAIIFADDADNMALVSDLPDTAAKFAEIDQLLNAWKQSIDSPAQSGEKTNQEEIILEIKADGKTFFSVQIIASEVKLPKVQSRLTALHINESILVDWDGEIYRYYIGEFASHAEARKMAGYLSSKGFEGAFVVKFVDGKKTESYY